MSAVSTRRRTTAAPSGLLRSTAMARLLRLTKSKALNLALGWPRVTSPVGGSILTTSAPRSASIIEHQAPAMTWVQSRTRRPASEVGDVMAMTLGDWRRQHRGDGRRCPDGRRLMNQAKAAQDSRRAKGPERIEAGEIGHGGGGGGDGRETDPAIRGA